MEIHGLLFSDISCKINNYNYNYIKIILTHKHLSHNLDIFCLFTNYGACTLVRMHGNRLNLTSEAFFNRFLAATLLMELIRMKRLVRVRGQNNL